MRRRAPTIETVPFLGGHVALDFANTVEFRADESPLDLLDSYDAFLTWSVRAGTISPADARSLGRLAVEQPRSAVASLTHAIKAREAIYRLFTARIRGVAPRSNDVEFVDGGLRSASGHRTLTATPRGYELRWEREPDHLSRPLWPVIEATADLLTSDLVERVRRCPGVDDCGWLFLDTSKNGTRKWCSMRGCGSRAKMRRNYQKQRSQ